METLCPMKLTICIIAGNRAYFANIDQWKLTLLSGDLKLKFYKTLILAVVTYSFEMCTIDENSLCLFEYKVI